MLLNPPPPQAGMHVLDPETLCFIGEIVLRAEAETMRACIPIFCTSWRVQTCHDDGLESEKEEEGGGVQEGSDGEEELNDGESVSEDGEDH